MRIFGDSPLRKSLGQQPEKLDLADRVKFQGKSHDIPSLLSKCTFLAHPSDSEGCPNVVMEAMSCGRAVVATDAGDSPYLVEDGKTGFVVRRGGGGALVERIATLITDRELCRRMGEAGRAKAGREFESDRLVSETIAACQTAGSKNS